MDEELEPLPTAHDYINSLIALTGQILAVVRGSAEYPEIDRLTEEMDEILIIMRHADWRREIG
jgi:hypothetical protein